MPAEFHLDKKKKIVYSRAWGHLTAQELRSHRLDMQSLFENRKIDGTWAQISSFQETTGMDKHPVQVVRGLAKNNPWPSSCPRAIITSNALTFGLARMYQMLGGSKIENFKVVYTLEEAEEHVQKCRDNFSHKKEYS